MGGSFLNVVELILTLRILFCKNFKFRMQNNLKNENKIVYIKS